MAIQYAFIEQFLGNIEDAISNERVKQIRFDFSVGTDGAIEVDLVAEDKDGVIVAEEIALDTFAEAIKYLEENI